MPSYGGGDDPWVEVIWTPTRRDTRRSLATALCARTFAVATGAVNLLAIVAAVLLATGKNGPRTKRRFARRGLGVERAK